MMAPSSSKMERYKGGSRGKRRNQSIGIQSSSMLLKLPRELRDQIYTYLFTSTELNFGKSDIIITHYFKTETRKPTPVALAILRTCRQINLETGPLWLGQVLFSFEKPKDMLDKLSELPPTILSQIRHVRTCGIPMMLQPTGEDNPTSMCYRLAWVLKLLPGLQLDRLTVLGASLGDLSYVTLEGLVQHSAGWRELYFITSNSMMLGFGRPNIFWSDASRRKPQPETWNKILLQRDGPDSGASITIYRSTLPCMRASPCTRQIFEQKVSSSDTLRHYGITEDEELCAKDEWRKELLVIAKRGRNANIVEQGGPPFETEFNIPQWAHGMTWPEIRRRCTDEFE